MTQQQLSLEVVWGTLLEGMGAVFAQQQMNKKQYMNLYTLVYNYCTNVSASNHFNLPRAAILHSRNTSRTKLIRGGEQDSFVGQDLYSKIRGYFTTHLEYLLNDRLTPVSQHGSSSEEILQVGHTKCELCRDVWHHNEPVYVTATSGSYTQMPL